MFPRLPPLADGDLTLLPGQLPPGEQAAAILPDSTVGRTQKQSGVLALSVGFVIAYVSARWRNIKNTRRPRAFIPGLVAVLETRLATIGAIAGGSLKLIGPKVRTRGVRNGGGR